MPWRLFASAVRNVLIIHVPVSWLAGFATEFAALVTTGGKLTTMISDRLEGDGRLGPEGDTRVRCWFCAHYTHNIELPIWKDGEEVWVPVRTCARGLGHDPFILRRCEAFKPISPRLRIRLPDEAFQRGWRADYGDDEHTLGRKNTI